MINLPYTGFFTILQRNIIVVQIGTNYFTQYISI